MNEIKARVNSVLRWASDGRWGNFLHSWALLSFRLTVLCREEGKENTVVLEAESRHRPDSGRQFTLYF